MLGKYESSKQYYLSSGFNSEETLIANIIIMMFFSDLSSDRKMNKVDKLIVFGLRKGAGKARGRT